MYIIELITRSGKICESFSSYERARQRIMQFKDEDLLGMPLIFKELPDGSQRLVREDGKPLQWHRLPYDGDAEPDSEPVPLADLPESAAGEEKGT